MGMAPNTSEQTSLLEAVLDISCDRFYTSLFLAQMFEQVRLRYNSDLEWCSLVWHIGSLRCVE